MEHRLYKPIGFADRPQRILIVGHSHHRQEHEEDHEDFTVDTVEHAKEGKMQRFPFFARQPRYLNLERRQYYETVALMNFIPVALLHRYAQPSLALLERGKQRFMRVLSEENPTHVFVLSSRLTFRQDLPTTFEEARGEPLSVLTTNSGSFLRGSYHTTGGTSLCCRLPHPQAASTAAMQEAFARMLAM
jgi:hypothetical protein